jgi:phage terminase large subunit-like protein
MKRFAEVAKSYGCCYIVADGHYRESFKEALAEQGMALVDAPEGLKGKQESFSRVRAVLHEGLILLPEDELSVRLIQQAKLVTAKPAPGGGINIKVPRKVGLGHGDLVSSWVVAVHRLAYGQVTEVKKTLEFGTAEYNQEAQRRLNEYYARINEQSLRKAEREVRAVRKGRRGDGTTFAR